MSDASGAAADAVITAAQNETADKPVSEWDAEAIAVAAASAGAAAYCSAVGLAAAAPLCAMVAGAVMEVVVDKIIGPLVDAFAGLFRDPPEPSLIFRDNCIQGPGFTADIDSTFLGFLAGPIATHRDLELPGTYGEKEAIWSMAMRGLELPRRVTIVDSYSNQTIVNAPMPPDFTAEYAAYKAQRMIELRNEYTTAWAPPAGVGQGYREVQVPMGDQEKCGLILDEFFTTRWMPWTSSMHQKIADENLNLAEVTIGFSIQQAADQGATQGLVLPSSSAAAQIRAAGERMTADPGGYEAMMFQGQLSTLVQQREQASALTALSDWIDEDPRNVPPVALADRQWGYTVGAGVGVGLLGTVGTLLARKAVGV